MSTQPSDDSQSQRLRLLTCPSCGAALPGSSGRVECAYCGTVIEFRKNVTSGSNIGGRRSIPAPSRPASAMRPARVGGCVALVVALVAVVGLGIFALLAWQPLRLVNYLDVPKPTNLAEQAPDLPAIDQTELTSTRKLLELSTDDLPAGAQPRSILLVRSQEDQKYHLALIDMAKQRRIWIGPSLSDNAYSSGQIAAASDTVVFADERTLYGFALNNGSKRWSTQLSDRVCDTCLIILKDTAVALSADSILAGVDLASGERLWSIDLGKNAGQELLIVGDQVLVLDRDADSHGQVSLIDPASGQVARRFVPECAGKTFPDNPIYANPSDIHWLSADHQTLMFISSSTDTCFHSYNLATGKQRWQTVESDSPYFRDVSLLQNGSELLIGNENQILAIDQGDGSVRVAFTNEDYTFHPLMIRDGVLATIAVKQRGTERLELWGVDPKSGKRLWRREFAGSGKMFESPYQAYGTLSDGDEIWALSNTSAGFVVTTLTAKPYRYTFELLDTKSGQIAATTTLDRPSSNTVWVPDVVARIDDLLYLNEGSSLIGIDVIKGTIVYQGP